MRSYLQIAENSKDFKTPVEHLGLYNGTGE